MTSPPPVLARYGLVMSGPCVCFISMYIQNLPATHVFIVVWRLVYTFCRPSLVSYGVSYFLASHSLKPAPFEVGLLLGRGLFLLQPTLLLFLQSLRVLPYCSTIPAVALFDPSLVGLFGLVAYSSLNDSV